MLHHFLVHAAFQTSRWLPREQRLKFQIVLFVFVVLFLAPQFYILSRPKSSRYCEKPLLNNLIVFIVFSFIATGLAVALTLTDPVPKSIRANTTTELYIFSLVVSWACILSTVFFLVRGGICLIHRLFPHWLRDTSLWG
ncbi:uncharacterized protein LOC130089080 isoform X2 [Rhinichthys klamathensis goyatoka]|uniref:uncharacterized protein LOC130089080 isoform X2 n=1 Tax=Rhinichthys klamathensis goyatoka TaxID=3034132 RepID=UPI0024B4CDA6|nr:uncharacterized protein LOC130089080 isoform X2 [Rhinichthys klamathensis goyatoka]